VLLFIAHCGRSFRGLTPHSIHVLVQPAKPKDRFTMAQRYVQMGVFDVLPPAFQAVGNILGRFLLPAKCGHSGG
jgi:hypothetical protein